MIAEVFEDKAAVTVFRGWFATKENGGDTEDCGINGGFDFAFGDEGEEGGFVFRPWMFFFFVAVEHFLGGGQVGVVDVVGVADFLEEIFEVVAFGEAGELGDVVEADVEEAADAMLFQEREELGCGFLRETDGTDFHVSSLVSAKRGIWSAQSLSSRARSDSDWRRPSPRMWSTWIPRSTRTRVMRSRRWQ